MGDRRKFLEFLFFFPSSWKREGTFSFLFINFLDFFVFLGEYVWTVEGLCSPMFQDIC